MNEAEFESDGKTQIETIKRLLDSAEVDIQEEISRTNQDWFACFSSVAWKNIPTLINTASLRGEISPEKEKAAQKHIDDLLGEVAECWKEYKSDGDYQETGDDVLPKASVYTEGVPPEEKRGYFLNKLKQVLEALEA